MRSSNLSVNAQCPDGRVRLQITDSSGQPFDGFDFDDCRPFTGDSLAWAPRWNGGSLAAFAEKMVRIGVEISNGRLYAIKGYIEYLHWLDIHKKRRETHDKQNA